MLGHADRLAHAGLVPVVTGIATRRLGSWLDPDGIDLAAALEATGRGTWLVDASGSRSGTSEDFIDLVSADVLVETTILDRVAGEPATTHVRRALQRGMDVVTTNKGPIACHGQALRALARERGRELRFESTVMDGCPVFSLVERTMPAVRIEGIRGILNSTSNYVTSRMRSGDSLAAALDDARRIGVAEADASNDLDGWDATMKLCCLANVLMEADLAPEAVSREDWREAPPGADGAWRQVALAERHADGTLDASVRWRPLRGDDVLAPFDGLSTAVSLRTDLLGEVTIGIRDPGTDQTAYGIVGDLVAVAQARITRARLREET
jgi:homoserine dehydrogenase